MLAAGGAHRDIEMSPETEQQLSSKDAGAADTHTCQACVDKDCASTQVSPLHSTGIDMKRGPFARGGGRGSGA